MEKTFGEEQIDKFYLNNFFVEDVVFLIKDKKILYSTKLHETLFGRSIKETTDIIELLSEYISKEDLIRLDNILTKDYDEGIFRIITNEATKWAHIKCSRQETGNYLLRMIDITNSIEYINEDDKNSVDYFSTMVHEFKTPLNLIFSSIQVINKSMELNNTSKDNFKKYLSIINQNSYRILKLVNNISDKNKIDSSYQIYNPSNNDIVCFIESICDSVCEFVSCNDMNIIFDTDVEELVISFDMEKIERIVLNLISNAIKFRKDKFGEIFINLSHDDEFVSISIKDNGIGIDENHLSNIFDKFSRINDERSIVKEGTGIGLYLVKSFVDLHLGTIDVDSKLGEWTEFKINIPNVVNNTFNKVDYDMCSDRVEKIKVEFSDIYSISAVSN